jgi:putative peptidoglycan lipid II flippase
VVSLLTGAGQLLNLGHEVVIAAYFGTSWMTDAYKMAMVLPILFTLELTTIINAVTIPVFYEYGGAERASETFSATFNAVLLFGLALTLATSLLSPAIIDVVARGFPVETRRLSSSLLRISSIGIFLAIASLYLSNILNAYRRFALPALQRVFLYSVMIAAIWVAGRTMGVTSAVIGYTLGILAFAVVLFRGVLQQGVRYHLRVRLRHPAVRSTIILAAPLLFFSVINQFGVLIEKRIVSGFDTGTLSSLDFAFKISVVLINFMVAGINAVLYPTLSESALADDRERLSSTLNNLSKALPAVVLPLSAVLICLRTPITSLIFERGAFDSESTGRTSAALLWYSVGLLGIAMVNTVPRFYQALKMNKALVRIGAVVVVVNVGLLLVLSNIVGYLGIAIATSLSALLHMTILLVRIRGHVVVNFRDLGQTLLKLLLGTLGLVIVVLSVQRLYGIGPAGKVGMLAQVISATFAGSMAYLGLCALLRVKIVFEFFQRVRDLVLVSDNR